MAAKQSAQTFVPRGLDPDFAPFNEGNFDALVKAVYPTSIEVSRSRFGDLVLEMNKAARVWQVLSDVDTAPTDKQEREHVDRIRKAAEKLATLLGSSFEVNCSEVAVTPPDNADHTPVEVPYDQGRIDRARQTGGTLPDEFPDDPTAEGGWCVPLVLERLLRHFDRRYRGDDSEGRVFEIPEEALNELAIMVRALAAGAADRLEELQVERPIGGERAAAIPSNCELRGDTEITLGEAKSAHHKFFLDLIPIYNELFDRKLGRSRTSPGRSGEARQGNEPSGPAIKFYRFVFDQLGVPRKGRADETIADWITDYKSEQGT